MQNHNWEVIKQPKPPWRPDWINAPVKVVHNRKGHGPSYRRELHPSGSLSDSFDGVLHQNEQQLRISIKPATKFERFWLAAFCLFPLALFPFAQGQVRGLLLIGGIAGFGCYVFATNLLHSHRQLGDYLVIDRPRNVVRLPRIGHSILIDDIVAVQWTLLRVGGGRAEEKIVRDLFLLARGPNDKETVRYHVLSPADRKLVRALADYLKKPVKDVQFGSSAGRNVDARSEFQDGQWINAPTQLVTETNQNNNSNGADNA